MVKSMYAGVAGLRTHQQKLDVIGNNVANVNTYGFKSGRVTFKESIYQTINGSSGGTQTYGGSNPSQIGYGSQLGTVDLMFTTGNYAPTDSQTDCMVDGAGFFLVGPKRFGQEDAGSEVENPEGTGGGDAVTSGLDKLSLTRVGNFAFDGDGYLVDGKGNVVYGFGVDQAAEGDAELDVDTSFLRAIRIPSVAGQADYTDAERMNLKDIKINANGEIVGTNAATGKVTKFGKVAIANVPNSNALEKDQGPYYKIAQNTGFVKAFEPGEGSTGLLMSNGLEMSNVDLAREFSDMITTQRGFQANTKIITVTDEMLQDLVNLKR